VPSTSERNSSGSLIVRYMASLGFCAVLEHFARAIEVTNALRVWLKASFVPVNILPHLRSVVGPRHMMSSTFISGTMNYSDVRAAYQSREEVRSPSFASIMASRCFLLHCD
jgi:hypothetical protein